MMALFSGFLPWIIGAGAAIATAAVAMFSARSSGVASQRAADALKTETDNATAAKARAGVDGLADPALDQRLRQFQRK